MPTLPAELLPLIVEFAPLFSKSIWEHIKILLVGAILATGKRTVTACLRITGKSQDPILAQNRAGVLSDAWTRVTLPLYGRLRLAGAQKDLRP